MRMAPSYTRRRTVTHVAATHGYMYMMVTCVTCMLTLFSEICAACGNGGVWCG